MSYLKRAFKILAASDTSYWTCFGFHNFTPDQLHCTHKYLGERSPEEAARIQSIIGAYFDNNTTDKFRVLFSEIDWYGADKDTRVLRPAGAQIEHMFHTELRKALDGFEQDTFPFSPHVSTDRLDTVDQDFTRYCLMKGDEIVQEWVLKTKLEARYSIVEADFKTAKKKFSLESSEDVVDEYLSTFKTLRDKNQIKDKDIDVWAKKGWEKFKAFVDSFKYKKTKTSTKTDKKAQGADLVAENEDWVVYKILTKDACILYGSNTKWCITEKDKNHFEEYSEVTDFYFIISKTLPKTDKWAKIAYQSSSGTYWDAEDVEHKSVPTSLQIPKFKVIPTIKINDKKYTYDEFYALKDLQVSGNLDLYGTKITSLPSGLTVGGSLNLMYTDITSLPSVLTVGGNLNLMGTKITSLPSDLKVGGHLYLSYTDITSLPSDLKVGNLSLRGTKITSLPSGLKVGGHLNLEGTKITSLPSGLKVGGSLSLRDTDITSLPSDLKVGGNLYLTRTKITSLPKDLKVGGEIIR